MMGVPLDGPAYVKADNMSVVHNCSTPASMLKKKSNSIAYHYIRDHSIVVCCYFIKILHNNVRST